MPILKKIESNSAFARTAVAIVVLATVKFTLVGTGHAAANPTVVSPDLTLGAEVTLPQDPLIDRRTKGDRNAPVTIYEITDFGCPWCRVFWEQTLPHIDTEYLQTGKAKLIFVNLPVPQLHPNSPAAHEFAMCSALQDRFWPIHDLLYRYQDEWSPLEDPRDYFISLADSAALDLDSLATCLETGSVRWLVQQESESVVRNGITSTPSFALDSLLLSGYEPIGVWRPILDSLFTAKTGGGREERN